MKLSEELEELRESVMQCKDIDLTGKLFMYIAKARVLEIDLEFESSSHD